MPLALAGLALFAATTALAPTTAGSGAPAQLWPVRFEDYVHPARRAAVRARAEATGGRWGAIDVQNRVWMRAGSRSDLLRSLERNGFARSAGGAAPAWVRR